MKISANSIKLIRQNILTKPLYFAIILYVADSDATRRKSECECAGTGRQARLRGVCQSTYGFKSRHSHHLQTQNQICGCGGMADALASGASVRKDVGVQVPPSAPRRSTDFKRNLVLLLFATWKYLQIPSNWFDKIYWQNHFILL